MLRWQWEAWLQRVSGVAVLGGTEPSSDSGVIQGDVIEPLGQVCGGPLHVLVDQRKATVAKLPASAITAPGRLPQVSKKPLMRVDWTIDILGL